MKFRLIALALLVPLLIGCQEKPTPEPKPEPTEASITAADITVEEGQTAQITAVTNSSAPIAYTSADAAIATVSETGLVTGVKAGETSVTLKVDAVEDTFTAAETTIKVWR